MTHRFLAGLLVAFAGLSLIVPAPDAAAGNPEPPPHQPGPSGWLGVFLQSTERMSKAQIQGVVEGSPAERAGLRARDHILAVDATRVASSNELISLVGRMEPGRWVHLTVERNGEEVELSARLIKRPEKTGGLRVRTGWLGLEAIDLPESLRGHFGAPENAGVMVCHVEPGSPAEAAGLELGDVVYEMAGEPLRAARELQHRVARGGVGNTVEIILMRHGSEITVEAGIEAAPE